METHFPIPSFIDEIFACPSCGSHPLPIRDNPVCCSSCGASYPRHNGTLNLIPPTPPSDLRDRWDLWTRLQDNGNTSYSLAPEINLTNDITLNIERFKTFMNLSGRILDIGCGPQAQRPAYIDDNLPEYVGVDPIHSPTARAFPYFQAIGECLPFIDASFNHVLFISSLDHTLSWRNALREGARVLAPGGSLHIMADDVDNTPNPQGIQAWLDILRKGTRQIVRGLKTMGPLRTLRYLSHAVSFTRPQGAMDPFHLEFPHPKDMLIFLEKQSLTVDQADTRNGLILINATKIR